MYFFLSLLTKYNKTDKMLVSVLPGSANWS